MTAQDLAGEFAEVQENYLDIGVSGILESGRQRLPRI